MKRLFLSLLLFNFFTAFAGNFTAGNIVVLRVGTGSALLTSSGHPVFLDEYTRAGVLVQSIPLPTATSGSNHPFTLSGTATSEGTLTLSANGQYLLMAGYDAVPGTPTVVGDSTINRVVARVGANGVPNTATGIFAQGAYVQDNIRSAVSSDGTKIWLAGNGTFDRGGTYYIPFGSFTASPVKISSPPNNTRTVSIFNNQLYVSSQTNTFNGVSILGNGLPTTAGQTTTLFPGFTAPSAFSVFSFWLFDMSPSVPGMDVLYFCDDRDVAPNGGLYKYSLVNGTWVSNGNVTVPNNLKGIAAERTCFTQIFCSSGTRVFSLRDDNGYNQPMTGTLTQIAMAASNTKFRGIAFTPGTATLTALSVTDAGTNVTCNGAGNGSITITATGGTTPYTYKWNNNSTSQNRTNLSPGTYTVTVTDANGCTASSSETITQPSQLGVSATKTDVSCNGGNNGTITLTVTGGTPNYSYAWNSGSSSQNRNNLSAGTYTVTVTDNKGCTASTSVTISQPTALNASATKTNVSCNNGSNGSVTLTVSGGVSPYDYDWSNNATTQNLSGIAAGTYTVTVTDDRNCTATASATVTQPAAMGTTTSVTAVRCNGGNDGAINLSVNGGQSPYTFGWSNSQSTEDISGLTAGSYSVTVNDANGCTVSKTNISVSQPTALSTTIVKTNVSCNGNNNGSIDLGVSGGTTPYTYLWSTQAASQDISGLDAGIYNVTVTDAANCTATAGTTITQPAMLSVSLTKTNVSCNGGNNGSIDLSVSGGIAAYTYQWSNNGSTQDLNGLVAAVYTVTVTDANLCSVTGSAAITEPALLASSLTKTEVSCNGGSNGSVDLSVSGGIAPYGYAWSNQAASQDIGSLPAGTYSVTITDANSCSSTNTATITQPALLTALLTKTDVLCNGGSTGAINLTVSGGTTPYTYDWSNNATSQNISGLAASGYSVVVTDAKNCTASSSATITEPAPITIAQTVTDASCNGGADGAIDITVSGGIGSYSYAWNTTASTEDISAVSAGLYQVTVEDGNDCVSTKSITVGESSALSISLMAKADITCTGGGADGSISIEVTGGLLPYTFNWSSGQSTEDITGLGEGNYTITVSDANNCSKVENYVINAAPIVSAIITRVNTNCNGGSDGSANLTVSGGTQPYTFAWSNNASTEDITGLAAGVYMVTVTDVDGCNASAGTIIAEPSAIVTAVSKTDILCHGGNTGAADLSVSGGTPPYTYNWSNNTALQDAGNLVADNYSVTITDNKGCIALDSVTITQPSELLITFTQANVSCKDGSDAAIHLDVTGGVAAYTFDWSNGFADEDNIGLSAGSYAVTVTDMNHCSAGIATVVTEPDALLIGSTQIDVSCYGGNNGVIALTVSGGTAGYDFNWSHGDSTENVSGLVAGNYAVTVIDANGCSALEGAAITEASEIIITAAITNAQCSGGNTGAIDLTVSGGTGIYDFLWSSGDTLEDVADLSSATYTVTVTDGNSCVQTFTGNVSQAGTLEVTRAVTHVSCNGFSDGSVQLFVTGGTPGYTFTWSNGQTAQGIDQLTAGNYSFTVSDANGCSISATDTITEPSAIDVSTVATDITCFGSANGSIEVIVSGGVSPYLYNWSNGIVAEENDELLSGAYTVTITDDNSCTATASADVTEPDALSIGSTVTDASAFGASDGAIAITVEGGTASYSFTWSSSATTEDLANVFAGEYCVTVTDANSCELSACFEVDQPSSMDEHAVVNAFNVFMQGGNLVIRAELNESTDGTLQVFDVAGRMLAAKDFRNAHTLNEELPFEYAGGCYFVNVVTEKGKFSRKIIAVR